MRSRTIAKGGWGLSHPVADGPLAGRFVNGLSFGLRMPLSLDRDLNDVVIFLQVVTSGSFTAAARELGMPTSTVSRRVSRLETQLGVQLLQRTTRKLSVTDAGRIYYERGTATFAGLEDAENILADAQANPKGRVRATVPIEHGVSMRLVTEFLRRYPDVRVDLELTHRNVNIIEEGYDASICAGPISNLSVVAHPLMDSPFRLVASAEYLGKHPAPGTLDELAEHECVVFGPASASSTWVFPNDTGGETSVQVAGRIAVNHMAAARDAALAGFGIALLPELICGADLAAGDLITVLPGVAPPPVPIWITHPAGRFLAPAVRAFVAHVRENFTSTAATMR